MKEWLGSVLIRAGYAIISDRHAFYLYRIMRLFWESVEGRELRRRLGLDEEAASDGTG